MKSRILVGLLALCVLAVLASDTKAQSLEFIFTKSGLMDALEYKEDLEYDQAVSTNALSLINVPQARLEAYLEGTRGYDAIVVFGEGALKAISGVPYDVPVIVVGAIGETAAGTTIHVMDSDFSGTAQAVGDASSLTLPATGAVTLRCDGIEPLELVQLLVSRLAS